MLGRSSNRYRAVLVTGSGLFTSEYDKDKDKDNFGFYEILVVFFQDYKVEGIILI
jgi:hypothetical protein